MEGGDCKSYWYQSFINTLCHSLAKFFVDFNLVYSTISQDFHILVFLSEYFPFNMFLTKRDWKSLKSDFGSYRYLTLSHTHTHIHTHTYTHTYKPTHTHKVKECRIVQIMHKLDKFYIFFCREKVKNQSRGRGSPI